MIEFGNARKWSWLGNNSKRSTLDCTALESRDLFYDNRTINFQPSDEVLLCIVVLSSEIANIST